jgi:DNA polymerase III delta subunit
MDGAELVSFCESRMIDDRDRLVIVDNADKLKATRKSAKTKGADALSEYIEGKAANDLSVILLAVIRDEVVPELWKKAAAKGVHREHNKAKPWETNLKLDRIEAEAALLGIKLGKNVATFLLQGLGDNLYTTRNELRKLALLVEPQGTITAEHASRIVALQPPAEPYEVADAALEKNAKRAMSLVAHLYRYSGEGALVPIVSTLMRHVERLLVVRSLLDIGKSKDEIASRLSMNAYRLQLTYLLWANRHSVERLKSHMAALCILDANVKGPARSKRTLVELAVLSIAA